MQAGGGGRLWIWCHVSLESQLRASRGYAARPGKRVTLAVSVCLFLLLSLPCSPLKKKMCKFKSGAHTKRWLVTKCSWKTSCSVWDNSKGAWGARSHTPQSPHHENTKFIWESDQKKQLKRYHHLEKCFARVNLESIQMLTQLWSGASWSWQQNLALSM